MLPHSKESKTNVQPKNRFRRICLKELSFQTIDIIKSESETCTVSLPLKVSKILKLVSSQVLSGNFTGIYSNTQTRPRHLTSILTKITQPHKQTSVPSLSHACSAQHACVTQASPGQQKQRDLQAEPLRFTTLPVLCNHILNLKHTKTTNRFKRKRRHIDPCHKSCAPAFTYFNLFKKIKFTQLQKRCANNGLTGCINIPF